MYFVQGVPLGHATDWKDANFSSSLDLFGLRLSQKCAHLTTDMSTLKTHLDQRRSFHLLISLMTALTRSRSGAEPHFWSASSMGTELNTMLVISLENKKHRGYSRIGQVEIRAGRCCFTLRGLIHPGGNDRSRSRGSRSRGSRG